MIVIAILTLIAAAYLAAKRAAPRPIYGRFHTAAFLGGCVTVAVALGSPLDEAAETRLSAHMIQHELLMVIAAPLLALGRAHWALLNLLARRRRRIAAKLLRFGRWNPLLACILHGVPVWIWHVPGLYQLALAHPLLHATEHVSFLGTALLFWWSVLDRSAAYGLAALYVFATSLHTSILGALLFFSPRFWYPAYGLGASALEDQQLAGLIMWIPAGFVLAATALLLISHWLSETERRMTARERLTSLKPNSREALAVAKGGRR